MVVILFCFARGSPDYYEVVDSPIDLLKIQVSNFALMHCPRKLLHEILRSLIVFSMRLLLEGTWIQTSEYSSVHMFEWALSSCLQQRLKTDEYEDVETFSRDMELLLDNAAKYYKPDSQERKDALLLKDVFLEAKERLCAEEDEGTV